MGCLVTIYIIMHKAVVNAFFLRETFVTKYFAYLNLHRNRMISDNYGLDVYFGNYNHSYQNQISPVFELVGLYQL